MSSNRTNETVECDEKQLAENEQAALTVLLVGATGTFGARLAKHLAREHGLSIVLAARREAPLRALATSLGLDQVFTVDRNALDAETLRDLSIDVVIDATGPFQSQRADLVVTSIEARAHYIDLADGRKFVAGISRFDAAAHQAGVAVISGASSTPALSHAVLDRLCAGWQRIDDIGAIICPSNRQRVGLAVVQAINATVGQPMRVFNDGRWTTSHGWAQMRRVRIPELGRRYASLVETPDLDLFVSRFHPTNSATFEAGLGLAVEHIALAAVGKLVRLGVLHSASALDRPLHAIGNRLRCFGVDVGIMEVRVSGMDEQGSPCHARWRLIASGESGPNVPVLAAVALSRRLRDGTLEFTGARPCTGLLQLEEFGDDLARLDIQTEIRFCHEPSANEVP